jgi:hypothetical protein
MRFGSFKYAASLGWAKANTFAEHINGLGQVFTGGSR